MPLWLHACSTQTSCDGNGSDATKLVTRHPGHRRPRSADITVSTVAQYWPVASYCRARGRAAPAHTHLTCTTPSGLREHMQPGVSRRAHRAPARTTRYPRAHLTTRSDYAPAGLVGSPPYTACTGSRRGVASRRARDIVTLRAAAHCLYPGYVSPPARITPSHACGQLV